MQKTPETVALILISATFDQDDDRATSLDFLRPISGGWEALFTAQLRGRSVAFEAIYRAGVLAYGPLDPNDISDEEPTLSELDPIDALEYLMMPADFAAKKSKRKAGAKKKKCTKGKSCGGSCIAKNKKCKKDPPSPAVRAAARALTNLQAEQPAQPQAKQSREPVRDQQPEQPTTPEPDATPAVNPAAVGGKTQNGVTHKPRMTEDEAVAYTANSVYKETLYHGTTQWGAESISTEGVDTSKNLSAIYGKGFYTARDPEAAATYADGGMLGMKLDIRNPKKFETRLDMEQFKQTIGLEAYDSSAAGGAKFTQALRDLGFDGIEVVDQEYIIAFDPSQVAVFDVNITPED